MTTLAIRKKLENYLKVVDDKKLKAVYTLLQDDINDADRISINDYNKEIDAALRDLKKGNVHSHAEVTRLSKK